MEDFNLYFSLGSDHILTWDALDHLLFITALCLRYLIRDWKKVIILVTAFTIGHSITLAAGAMGLVHFSRSWIEFLIPLTILFTATANLRQKSASQENRYLPLIYYFAVFFGLIHGLAYASSFLSLEGKENLVAHLFAFNLGIEAAQIVVVAFVLLCSFVVVQLLQMSRVGWIRIGSFLIAIVSLKMAFERWPYHNHLHT